MTDHPYDDPTSQAARRHALENDKRVREQGTTYASFAEAFLDEDRQGRFQALKPPTHTAATPVYPEQPENSPFHHDPCGPEAPLGFSIDQMEPVGTQYEIERSLAQLQAADDLTGGPAGGEVEAPSSEPQLDVEPASPLSNKPDDDEPPRAV